MRGQQDKSNCYRIWCSLCGVVVYACCADSLAQTVTSEISAQFKNGKVTLQNPSSPDGRLSFTELRVEKNFHLRGPNSAFNGQMVPLEIRRKAYMYYAINPAWKTVALSNGRGQSANVRIRLTSFSGRYILGGVNASSVLNSLVANRNSGNCPLLGFQAVASFSFTFEAGLSSDGMRACYWEPSDLNNLYSSAELRDVRFAYLLELASKPDGLPNGVYHGAITYSVGPGQDIDVGDASYASASETVAVSMAIQHDLKVTTQSGSSVVSAQLLPPEGRWSAITGKRVPQLSTVKIPLNIDTTGPFSVKQDGRLILVNPHAVNSAQVLRLSTELSFNQGQISIPPGSTAVLENGKLLFKHDFSRLMVAHITPDPAGRVVASVRFYFDTAASNGAIHEGLAYQIRRGNQRWRGSTTLVFDSELN